MTAANTPARHPISMAVMNAPPPSVSQVRAVQISSFWAGGGGFLVSVGRSFVLTFCSHNCDFAFCPCWLDYGQMFNTDVFLLFLIPVEQFPPVFISKPEPQTVYVGKRAVIQCVITGSAPLNVVWLKDNQPNLPAHYHASWDKNKHTLVISSVEAADSGLFVCKVTNNVGTAECNTELRVVGKPSFVKALAPVAAVVAAPLHLECQVDEDTGVSVTWTRDGRKVHQSPDCKLLFEDKTVTLDIPKTTLKDCGSYVCTVANEAGSASCSASVKVQGKKCPVNFQGNCSICSFYKSAVLEINSHVVWCPF